MTDFGSGLLICIGKFLQHMNNELFHGLVVFNLYIKASLKDRELMLSSNPPSSLNYGKAEMEHIKFWVDKIVPIRGTLEKTFSNEIETFMNGASDHFYDLKIPDSFDLYPDIREMIKELSSKSLEMGHGFTHKIWTMKDLDHLIELANKILLEIDQKIFEIKNADIGEYS